MWEKYGIQVENGVMRNSAAASGRQILYVRVLWGFFWFVGYFNWLLCMGVFFFWEVVYLFFVCYGHVKSVYQRRPLILGRLAIKTVRFYLRLSPLIADIQDGRHTGVTSITCLFGDLK